MDTVGDNADGALMVATRKKPFPEALHDMVTFCHNHSTLRNVIRWSPEGTGFCVFDRQRLQYDVLPWAFRHANFASLERQLSNYGFSRRDCGVGVHRYRVYCHDSVSADGGVVEVLFHQEHAERAKQIRLLKSVKRNPTKRQPKPKRSERPCGDDDEAEEGHDEKRVKGKNNKQIVPTPSSMTPATTVQRHHSVDCHPETNANNHVLDADLAANQTAHNANTTLCIASATRNPTATTVTEIQQRTLTVPPVAKHTKETKAAGNGVTTSHTDDDDSSSLEMLATTVVTAESVTAPGIIGDAIVTPSTSNTSASSTITTSTNCGDSYDYSHHGKDYDQQNEAFTERTNFDNDHPDGEVIMSGGKKVPTAAEPLSMRAQEGDHVVALLETSTLSPPPTTTSPGNTTKFTTNVATTPCHSGSVTRSLHDHKITTTTYFAPSVATAVAPNPIPAPTSFPGDRRHSQWAVLPPNVPPLPCRHDFILFRREEVSFVTLQLTKKLDPTITRRTCGVHENDASSLMLAISGTASMGKTTLASIVVRGLTVRQFYSDGIAWIRLSKRPISTLKQLLYWYNLILSHVRMTTKDSCSQLLSSFDACSFLDRDDEEDIEDAMELAHAAMSAFLVHRKILLVIDNVFHPCDVVRWFNFGRSDERGAPLRVLWTTRLCLSTSLMESWGINSFTVTLGPLSKTTVHEALSQRGYAKGRYDHYNACDNDEDKKHDHDNLLEMTKQCGYIPHALQVVMELFETRRMHEPMLCHPHDKDAAWKSELHHLFRRELYPSFQKTFEYCIPNDVSTREAVMNIFQTLARVSTAPSTSPSSTCRAELEDDDTTCLWMSYDVMKRLLDGSRDLANVKILDLLHLLEFGLDVTTDKTAVVLQALTKMGFLTRRRTVTTATTTTTAAMQGASEHQPSCHQTFLFDYKLGNPLFLTFAEQLNVSKICKKH